jgi:hypothetical protein
METFVAVLVPANITYLSGSDPTHGHLMSEGFSHERLPTNAAGLETFFCHEIPSEDEARPILMDDSSLPVYHILNPPDESSRTTQANPTQEPSQPDALFSRTGSREGFSQLTPLLDRA